MSVADFCRQLHTAQVGKHDREWFPRWIRRYASGVEAVEGRLPVNPEDVIRFLRSLLKNQVPAWQRLQAVRAIEAYRVVLQSKLPPLEEIRRTLSRLADQERAAGAGASRPGVQDERHLIGRIDPNEPELIQRVRKEMRVRHKALETERAYVGWVQRFIRHCGSPDLAKFGDGEIKTFSSGQRIGWGLRRTPYRIRCATVSRPICSKTVRTSAPCRSCLGTRTSARR